MNGDTLWVWCYPSVSSDLRQVLLRKCCLTQDGRDFHTFVFGQFCRTWYYITTAEVQEPTALNKVQCCTADLCQRAVSTQHEQLFIHVCNMQMFCFFPLPFKITHFSVVITAKDFNPEKYAALNRVLCRYCQCDTLLAQWAFNSSSLEAL